MNTKELYSYLQNLNVNLFIENNQLRFKAPKGIMTDDILNMIREQKTELILLLQNNDQSSDIAKDPDNIPDQESKPGIQKNIPVNIKEILLQETSNILRINAEEVKDDLSFSQLGMDSIMTIEFLRKINSAFDLKLKPADIPDNSDINKLLKHISHKLSHKAPAAGLKENSVKETNKPQQPGNEQFFPGQQKKSSMQIKLIDKKYVHKHKKRNVMVYNLRRVLPRKISVDSFQNMLSRLNADDKEFMQRFYSIEKDVHFPKEENQYYILHSIPLEIEVSTAIDYILTSKTDLNEARNLLKYYYRDRNTKKFILKEGFSDYEEMEILNILQHKDWYITDFDKARISAILENFPEIKKIDLFYANMFVDPTHKYFFEHPNEHVPGMAIIEATRQFTEAVSHKYLNIPFKGASFIFQGMQIFFKRYLELHYPILMVASPKFQDKPGYLMSSTTDIAVYQKNKECASLKMTGDVIEKDVFLLLRDEEPAREKKPRFHTRSIFYNNISIKDKKGKEYLCSFIDLSEHGFQIQFPDTFDHAVNEEFTFLIFFQEIGFIQGKCRLIWPPTPDSENKKAGFKIIGINETDNDNLKEAIKRYCYVREERELL